MTTDMTERATEAWKIERARHPGRWVAAAAVLVLLVMLVNNLLTNQRFEWGVVRSYFTTRAILAGVVQTLLLTALAMLIGIVVGVLLAVMRFSPNPLVKGVSAVYVWFFRGTPVLVQLLFLFNISALIPRVSLGIPFGPEFVAGSANTFVTGFVAAVLGLGLNEGAYMAEIVRGGILSVDHGQSEAALALGMRRSLSMRLIVLPQAMRVIIPPMGNEVIGMLKTTSIVSVIAVPELLNSTQLIYSRTYQVIPLLIVACLWYLVMTSVLSLFQVRLERRFSRGGHRSGQSAITVRRPGWVQKRLARGLHHG